MASLYFFVLFLSVCLFVYLFFFFCLSFTHYFTCLDFLFLSLYLVRTGLLFIFFSLAYLLFYIINTILSISLYLSSYQSLVYLSIQIPESLSFFSSLLTSLFTIFYFLWKFSFAKFHHSLFIFFFYYYFILERLFSSNYCVVILMPSSQIIDLRR